MHRLTRLSIAASERGGTARDCLGNARGGTHCLGTASLGFVGGPSNGGGANCFATGDGSPSFAGGVLSGCRSGDGAAGVSTTSWIGDNPGVCERPSWLSGNIGDGVSNRVSCVFGGGVPGPKSSPSVFCVGSPAPSTPPAST